MRASFSVEIFDLDPWVLLSKCRLDFDLHQKNSLWHGKPVDMVSRAHWKDLHLKAQVYILNISCFCDD
ncbi:hypothetical protein DPMN_045822 [Dreissena polymorpha]|uniref:Uncharacterized protein n=1 Tax=Dreissena polymorpha TaxID=45954 RepID=A0A9D4D6T7_DREPO|nr:hypothetical protein DPMN_045822 [Dreissena polymorpha]